MITTLEEGIMTSQIPEKDLCEHHFEVPGLTIVIQVVVNGASG